MLDVPSIAEQVMVAEEVTVHFVLNCFARGAESEPHMLRLLASLRIIFAGPPKGTSHTGNRH